MISPEFRVCHPTDIIAPIRKHVKESHGDDLWLSLEPHFV